jgi:hypothetical protein
MHLLPRYQAHFQSYFKLFWIFCSPKFTVNCYPTAYWYMVIITVFRWVNRDCGMNIFLKTAQNCKSLLSAFHQKKAVILLK